MIGGAEVYKTMFPLCQEIYLSYVFHPYDGDTHLVEFEEDFALAEILYRDENFELRRYEKVAP